MKKILVTGGAGFIGSHLVKQLLKENNQVIVIDDFSTGKKENLPIDKRLRVHKVSILGNIGKLFKDVDIVFHLAALTNPQISILHPKETTYENVDGTVRILEQCVKKGVKKLVFVSSSSLYGDQKLFPTPESVTPNPKSPYALTKIVGEQYCKLYEKLYGLKVNCVRPYNVYGYGQSVRGQYSAAVPTFIKQLNSNVQPHITGDGNQPRDYVYIDDVVDLLILASKSNVSGEAFNAGSGTLISINDLYYMICKLMKKNVKPRYVPPVVEPKKLLADIKKAKRLLGWEPKISLEEGLRRTIFPK